MQTQMTSECFNEVFENGLKEGKGVEESYEATERLHEIIFGQRRYSDVDSFRTSRARKLKHKRS